MMKLIINPKFYNMLKKEKCETEYVSFIKFRKKKFLVKYENRAIQNSNYYTICTKNVISFVNPVYDIEFIQYICNHENSLDITINRKNIKHYPAYALIGANGKLYLENLKLVEF